MSKSSLIFKNSLFLYLRSFLVLCISLYTSRKVLEVLGVVDFGIYNAVGGIIAMLSFINNSFIGTYQRYYNMLLGSNEVKSLKTWFGASLSTQFLLVFFVLFCAETVGLWFLNFKMSIPNDRIIAANWIYQASIITVIFTILQAPYSSIITAYERMNVIAIISILDAILKLLGVLLLWIIDVDHLILYSIFLMLISLVDYTCHALYFKNKVGLGRIRLVFDKNKIRRLLSFSGYTMADMLSQALKSNGINILLNIFFGPVVNAARGVAYQVLGATNQFVSSFQTAFRPQLTKSYAENDNAYLMKLYYSACKLSFFLLLLITVPLIVETDAVLRLWLGNNVPEHSIIFTRLILFTSWVSCFANPTSCIVYATGNIKKFTLWVSGLNLLILPVSYIFLTLGFSPESSMYVSLIITIIVQVIRMNVLHELVAFSYVDYLSKVIKPSLIVVAISLSLSIVFHKVIGQGTINSLAICMCSFVSTLGCIWLCGMDELEKKLIHSKLRGFIRK